MNEGITSTENPPTGRGSDLVPGAADGPAETPAELATENAADVAALVEKQIG